MFSYIAILAVAIAGYAGMSPISIGIGALALLALSISEHGVALHRGRDLELQVELRSTLLGVATSATLVTIIAYSAGLALRLTAVV
jgi:hypothetical protein